MSEDALAAARRIIERAKKWEAIYATKRPYPKDELIVARALLIQAERSREREVIEKCAKVCVARAKKWFHLNDTAKELRYVARQIRALKHPQEGSGDK